MIEYDPHLWRDHLLDVRGSVLKKVAPRVLLLAGWAGLVGSVGLKFPGVGFPATAHALVGVALGLLLVFRTNASYDRFWEGRRQWGSIINAARNLARGSIAFMGAAPAPAGRVRDWTVGFAHGVMHRLRNTASLGSSADLFTNDEARLAVDSGNVPLAAATQISRAIVEARRAGAITDHEQLLMDTQVAALVDASGACDRIHKTPLPFAYVVHLRRALLLYCGTLPFATLEGFGWGEVLVTTLVAFVLLGIEEIGVEIEDPFGTDDNDLPLEKFCETVERDMRSVCVPVIHASTTSPEN
ncbi:MAG: bestrophin family protein [Gemmataceae bacterium]|nr:bestrophin family protein [Gemmataceae bacterium]